MARRARLGVLAGVIVGTLALVGVVFGAPSSGGEQVLQVACARVNSGLMRYVANASDCKSGSEAPVRIAALAKRGGVVHACTSAAYGLAQVRNRQGKRVVIPRGTVWRVDQGAACSSMKQLAITLSGPSGLHFCASKVDGLLRLVRGAGDCDRREFPVFVPKGRSRAPVAISQEVHTDEGVPVAVTLRGSSRPAGKSVSYLILQGPAHGKLSGDAANLLYAPAAGFSGKDQFSFVVVEGALKSKPATVTIVVGRVDEAPTVGVPVAQKINEGTGLVFSATDRDAITVGDADADGASEEVRLAVSHGVLSLGSGAGLQASAGNGSGSVVIKGSMTALNGALAGLSYTPTKAYHGGDSLSVEIDDLGHTGAGGPKSAAGSVAITVVQVDQTPALSAPAAQSAAQNTSLAFSAKTANGISVSDVDSEGGVERLELSVAHGTLAPAPGTTSGLAADTGEDTGALTLEGTITQLNEALEGLVYAPVHDYKGADELTVAINDEGHTGIEGPKTAEATVPITVSAAVYDHAVPDGYTTSENATLSKDPAEGVLVNDTDSDSLPLRAELVSGPAHGTLTLNADGSFTYTPAANYKGSDSFTYEDNDGNTESNTATVSITIAPVVYDTANNDSYTVHENTTLSKDAVEGVLTNDTDTDSPPLPLSAELVKGPAHGTLQLQSDGSFTYEPDTDYHGSDSFEYRDQDGNTGSNTATVTIGVERVDRVPTVSVPLDQSTTENTRLTFSGLGTDQVSVGDEDSEGGEEKITVSVEHGTLQPGSTAGLKVSGEGTSKLELEGTIAALNGGLEGLAYSPAHDYKGSDELAVEINDEGHTGLEGPKTAKAKVPIAVGTVVYDHAAPDSYVVGENETLDVSAPGVLANDTDTDSPPLSLEVEELNAAPAHGGLVLSSDGSFTYTPESNYQGSDSFSYTDYDGNTESNTATVTIDVDAQPAVSSITPADGTEGVALGASMTVTFSKAVSAPAGAFELECPSGTSIPFSVSPTSGAHTSFTLTPDNPLPADGECAVKVLASEVTDSVGTHPSGDFASSFRTDERPSVSSTAPMNDASGVSSSQAITVTFSKQVSASSGAFEVECPSGTPVGFTTSFSPASSYTLTPSTALPVGTTCAVTVVASEIEDSIGTHPASDYGFSFTTDTAPQVSATTPSNGATGVAPSSSITVQFSKAVSAPASAFELECPSGTSIPLSVSPASGESASFTLTPESSLPTGDQCTVKLLAGEIVDAEGTHPASDSSFSFTTDTPPSVSSTTPANGATNTSLSAPVSVTFDKAVNVTGSAFTLQCPTGTPETFTLSPAPPGGVSTYTLTPSAALPANTVCTVTVVATQVSDSSGVHPANNHSFTFTTDTPPSVSSTTPANEATNVPTSSTLTINFDKAVSAPKAAFKIECPSGTSIPFSVSPSSGENTSFTLTPEQELPGGEECAVKVLASEVTDSVGTHPSGDFASSFRTDERPSVSSTAPANNASSVPSSQAITVTFSKQVSASSGAFEVECPSGTPVGFTTSSSPASSYTLTPSADLPVGTTCAVTVVASEIEDSIGTHPASDYGLSFTTDTAPQVSSTTPSDGATGVAPSSSITVQFSKAVSAPASAFELECPSGTSIPLSVSPASGESASFTLTPESSLPTGEQCTVKVLAGEIVDAEGTHPASDSSFSFTTDTPPSVSSTTPANGATNTSLSAPVSVTFDKAVNVTGSAFTLQCPTGTPETFTLSPAPPGRVSAYTVTPSAALPANTVCTVTVVAAQVSDSSGVHPATNYSFSFTTDTPPSVSSTTPANEATNVPTSSTVTINFDKAVSAPKAAFKIECPSGTSIPFSVSPSSGENTSFTLTPEQELPGGEECVVKVLASEVADASGTHPASNFSSSFTVETQTPTAIAHTYDGAIGDTTFGVGTTPTAPSTSTSGNVLEGDAANGGTLKAESGNITTSQDGTVEMNENGTFTYHPPVGCKGDDTFTYTDTNGHHTNSNTVTIDSTSCVWYVNDNASSEGNGESNAPFKSLATIEGGSDPTSAGNTIFLYGGGSSYGGNLKLQENQTLAGESQGLTVEGHTLVAPTGSNPTIASSSGDAVTVASGDTIRGMTVSKASDSGILGTGIKGLTIEHSDAIGNDTSGSTAEAGLKLTGASGAVTIGTTTISGSAYDDATIVSGGSGTLTLAVTHSTFGPKAVEHNDDGLAVEAIGTASVTVTANEEDTFKEEFANGLETRDKSSGAMHVTVDSDSFTNNSGTGVDIETESGGPVEFTVKNNKLTGQQGNALNLFGDGSGTMEGEVVENEVGITKQAHSGSVAGSGIEIDSGKSETLTTNVSKNKVFEIESEHGIEAHAGEGSATLNLTLQKNEVHTEETSSLDGIFVDSGVNLSDTSVVCMNALENTSVSAGTEAGNLTRETYGFVLVQQTPSAVFQIQGYKGSGTSNAEIDNYLAGKNTLSAGGGAAEVEFDKGFSSTEKCPTVP
jgi:large repetitive protein